MAGILLLIFAVFLGEWVGMILMAALVAVMIVTVLVVVLTHHLAYGVFAGVLLSTLFFANKVGQLLAVGAELSADGRCRFYRVTGQVFFSSADAFVAAFDRKEAVAAVQIDLTLAHFGDISAINSLDKLVLAFRKAGIEVEVTGLNQASTTLVDKFAVHHKPEVIRPLLH
jgi:SulP family sulfate permease